MIFRENNDEQRLAKRLHNGENGAMETFYTLYAERLAGVCSRYVIDQEDMKDVFQNAFLSIITHIGEFEYRGEGSLLAWAKKIVVSEALRFLRTVRRQELMLLDRDITEESEEDDPPVSDLPPEVIHQMVSQLPTGYRAVLNLYVFENRNHQEIARLLGIQERTSASQLCRAKNLLAKMIQQFNDDNNPRR